MKKLYIMLITFMAFFNMAEVVSQQEIQFTQYIFNTMSVNPAYTGYKEQTFAQLALRNQWVGLDGAPKTGQFSIDGIVSPTSRNVGLGLQITSDRLGPQSATSFYLNYAYRIRLDAGDTKRLSFGLAAGLGQYGVDGSQFSMVDGGDASFLYTNESEWKWNLRLGAYYYSPKWYAGISLMNVVDNGENSIFGSDPDNYFVVQQRHMYFIVGAMLNMTSNLKLRPSIMVKDDFKGPTSLDANAMLLYNERFWFGASYRTGVHIWDRDYSGYSAQGPISTNAVSGIVQFYLSQNLRIGYSYDFM